MLQTTRRIFVSRTKNHDTDQVHEILSELSDEDLMVQFQQGVVQAYEMLYERYTDKLIHFVYDIVKDFDEAEDIVQQTWVNAHRNRHSFCRIARFSTWIYTIARNLAVTIYRQRKHHQTYSIHRVNDNGDEWTQGIIDAALLPDEKLDRAIQSNTLHVAIKKIKPEYAEVVVLRDIQAMSYQEIAQITGLPMGTVKSRINRGRKAIALIVAPNCKRSRASRA